MATVICRFCKKEFNRWGNPRKGSAYVFCGRKCYWDSMKKKELCICKTCSKEFRPKGHVIKQKYCSKKCQPAWNKGTKGVMKAWNKGKSAPWANWKVLQTRKSREKSRIAKIGKPSPFRGKSRPELRGINNPLWKGGSGTERHQEMSKIEYKLWRTAVFVRDNYTCQICNHRGGKLEADHIKPWSLYPELRYSIDNGRTLCRECHLETETWGRKSIYFERRVD